jgi:hypothetical protein
VKGKRRKGGSGEIEGLLNTVLILCSHPKWVKWRREHKGCIPNREHHPSK